MADLPTVEMSETGVVLVAEVTRTESQARLTLNMTPTCESGIPPALVEAFSDRWVRDAPAGTYTFGYDAGYEDADEGAYLLLDAPTDEAFKHASEIGRDVASVLMAASDCLQEILGDAALGEEFYQKFDEALRRLVERCRDQGSFVDLYPGAVPLLLLPREDCEVVTATLALSGQKSVAAVSLLSKAHPFFTHIRDVLMKRFQPELRRRERKIVQDELRVLTLATVGAPPHQAALIIDHIFYLSDTFDLTPPEDPHVRWEITTASS